MANLFSAISAALNAISKGFAVFVYILVISIGSFISSLIGDPNYTGGNPNTKNGLSNEDWWWVETYDECLDAIEQLKANGSNIDTSALFYYEGDEFDVKYCFALEEKIYIKYGRDNPFKYKSDDVKIYTYLFHKDTTIDDFAYKFVGSYCSYYFRLNPDYIESGKYRELDASDLERSFNPNTANLDFMQEFPACYEYTDKETGEVVFHLFGFKEKDMPELSDEAVDAILDSIVIVENND